MDQNSDFYRQYGPPWLLVLLGIGIAIALLSGLGIINLPDYSAGERW